jgi:hypothetical protein
VIGRMGSRTGWQTYSSDTLCTITPH